MSRKIGLALGGGGARGWAHVGVLRALEEDGIPIHCVAGTSIGALVGGVYVRDKLHALEELADDFDNNNLGNNVIVVSDTTGGIRQVAQHPGGIYYASAPEIVGQCTVKALPLRSRSSGRLVTPYAGERVPIEDCPKRRNQVNLESIQDGTYPLTRHLFVGIKQNGEDHAAGEAYASLLLTDEGQRLIRATGFIPLR